MISKMSSLLVDHHHLNNMEVINNKVNKATAVLHLDRVVMVPLLHSKATVEVVLRNKVIPNREDIHLNNKVVTLSKADIHHRIRDTDISPTFGQADGLRCSNNSTIKFNVRGLHSSAMTYIILKPILIKTRTFALLHT